MTDAMLSDLLPYDQVKDDVVDLAERVGARIALRCFRSPDAWTRATVALYADEAKVLLLRPTSWAHEKLLGVRVRIFHAEEGARLFVRGPFAVGPKDVRVPLLDDAERPAEAFAHPSRLVRLRGEVLLVGGHDPLEIVVRAEGGLVFASIEAVVEIVEDRAAGYVSDEPAPHAADLDRVLVPFRAAPGDSDEIIVPSGGRTYLAGPCGWGVLRVLGIVASPVPADEGVLTIDRFGIGGSTNLLQDEDAVPLTSIAAASADGPWFFRLRHELLLKAPNVAQITLGVEGARHTTPVRLWLYAAVVEAYAVQDARALHGLLCEDLPRGAKHVTFQYGRRRDPSVPRMPRITDVRSGGRALLLFEDPDVVCVEAMFPAEANMDAARLAAALRRLADTLDGGAHG